VEPAAGDTVVSSAYPIKVIVIPALQIHPVPIPGVIPPARAKIRSIPSRVHGGECVVVNARRASQVSGARRIIWRSVVETSQSDTIRRRLLGENIGEHGVCGPVAGGNITGKPTWLERPESKCFLGTPND